MLLFLTQILAVSCLCIVLRFDLSQQHRFCELQHKYNFSPFCSWCSTEDAPESPSGPSSPKVALLPPVLKKVPSDKEKDGQSSPSVRSFSQEGRSVGIVVPACLSSLPPDLFSRRREGGYLFGGKRAREVYLVTCPSSPSTHGLVLCIFFL